MGEKSSNEADQGGKLFDAAEKVYTETQRTFTSLKTEINSSMCPQLPPSAIGVNYEFQDWVQDKNMKATFHCPDVDLKGTLMSEFKQDMFEAENIYKTMILEAQARLADRE